MKRIRNIILLLLVMAFTFSGCGTSIGTEDADSQQTVAETVEEEQGPQITYSYANKDEGIEYMMSNTEYYDNFTQNELDYKMGKKDANMDEYKEFAKAQVLSFTDGDKEVIDEAMSYIEEVLAEQNMKLPDLDPVVFIKTTQKEESDSGAYTHGTQIYLGATCIDYAKSESAGAMDWFKELCAHEVFHCLTRSNPEFRKDMYSLIHFTVQDKEFAIPPSVEEYFINNPDVEHHNSYATFNINGKDIDCFTALISTEHFENEGDSFFDCMTTALVPIDGTDTYYTPEEASNFYDVFGENTGYVIDPEECLADNFSYAVLYGKEGPTGEGYATQEIIDGIVDYLQK